MPVGFGRKSVRSKGALLAEMVRLKRSIIEVRAKTDRLAHALIIAIARITNDPNYNSYRQGCKIFQRFSIYCKQVSIYNTGEESQNSSDFKITFQSTEL